MAEVLETVLPAVAAGTPLTQLIAEIPADVEEYEIGDISIVPAATAAAQGATNFATLAVRQLRAGVVVQTLATLSLGTATLTAEIPNEFVQNDPMASAQFQAGDVIDLRATHTGTGGALAAGAVLKVELP